MNAAMEIHDSRLIELCRDAGGTGFVLFRASDFRSEGKPGEDAQVSGWQNVRISFTEMTVEGSRKIDYPHARGGFLSLDGDEHNGLIAFPVAYTCSVVFSVEFIGNLAATTIRAASISIDAEGDFQCEHVWDVEGNIAPFHA